MSEPATLTLLDEEARATVAEAMAVAWVSVADDCWGLENFCGAGPGGESTVCRSPFGP